MKTPDLLGILQEFQREKLALLLKHIAGARLVGQSDVNNTYQYIVNREEAHLSWLSKAIAELGGTPAVEATEPGRSGSGKGDARLKSIAAEDARDAAAFVERWRPRVEAMDHARHRLMLRVILGEMLEQQRFFDQAAAGRDDLLGRRTSPSKAAGTVLPTRWVE